LRDGGIFVSLIKPQFEAGKSALGKNGIVKSPRDRENAVIRVIESAEGCGFSLNGLVRSPIVGGDGNREYLALFIKENTTKDIDIQTKLRIRIKELCAD
jgi:23S rRNA (cytidine1920-2'-O)/16S rRNA (cytidine1409-2'-O)-methyltransferase